MSGKRVNNKDLCFFPVYIFILAVLFCRLTAQTYSVGGTVSVSTTTVRNALITFIDRNDTTARFSAITDSLGNYQLDVITGLKYDQNSLPVNFELGQNYPNPFSGSTSIPYKLNQKSEVQVTIYDALGRTVKNFSLRNQAAGNHNILWNGADTYGQRLAAGIYFYRFQAGGENQIRKMILYGGTRTGITRSQPESHISFPKSGTGKDPAILGGNFRVRIENTVETFPLINTEVIENQEIQGSTTLNYSVSSYYPIANSDINLDDTRQIIRGFGAANILPWRPDMTASEIQKAFGTGDGQIGFSILRLRLPNSPNEFAMNLATAKAAYDMGVTIMASPWSPPAFMKTNTNTVGGSLKEASYADFAAHLKSFADYMSQNGVTIHSISVQNEPDVTVTYESCDYSAAQMLKFMKENAPAVGVPVCAPESYYFARSMSDPILNDSVATANTVYISGHIYGGGLTPYPLAVEKGKEVWMTEHLVTDISWSSVLATGKEIHECMVYGMSAYIWWYIVRFYGPIIDDDPGRPAGTQKGDVSKRGFVMSQFARFIRPGYYRVECNAYAQRNVYVSCYKEDNSAVSIVAVNTGTGPVYQTFTISNGDVNTVRTYTTTQSKNCVRGDDIAVLNGSFTALVEPSGITTFVSN